jgi:acyl-coenzyme A synthetase/AMP-(fatty) acid ligase
MRFRLLQARRDRRAAEQPLKAYVVLRHVAKRLDAAGLKEFVARHIAAHTVPERIKIRSELPLNEAGKVDRHALQALAGRSG